MLAEHHVPRSSRQGPGPQPHTASARTLPVCIKSESEQEHADKTSLVLISRLGLLIYLPDPEVQGVCPCMYVACVNAPSMPHARSILHSTQAPCSWPLESEEDYAAGDAADGGHGGSSNGEAQSHASQPQGRGTDLVDFASSALSSSSSASSPQNPGSS